MAEAQIINELVLKFGKHVVRTLDTRDGLPTFVTETDRAYEILRHLKSRTYAMLYDLTAIDNRALKPEMRPSDFTVVYHLLSFERNEELRVKVHLNGEYPAIASITGLWPSANWYERECWDMFGIKFTGHPTLRRILMPRTWTGHPLRKDHPGRATEMEPFALPDEKQEAEERALEFNPDEWGMAKRSPRGRDDAEFMFLNLGPHHPGTHGVFRIILQLDGEVIVDAVPEIGFHHRGAEKMGELQTWHTFIPYTDRVDYLSGVLNNLPYVLAVEKLAGIVVPERTEVIRIMLCELFRIASHLVWYGTFAQDVGAMSPVFYMFTDRERIFEIIEMICGGRMHPSWFRIGGVAQDLPKEWDKKISEFLDYMPKRLKEYDVMVMQNWIFKARTKGIGSYTTAQAIDAGVTGPGLRATGLKWDLRKKRPYSGYERFEFEIPIAIHGDCYDRAVVRVEEIRQSLRIIEQCVKNMPSGPYKADHPLVIPPRKERTMHDIETLITHFLGVSWGAVMPQGEVSFAIEGAKGMNSYHVISDGGTKPYRVRIRAPSFPHLQMIPQISQGLMVADLLAILGSIDYVLADVDR